MVFTDRRKGTEETLTGLCLPMPGEHNVQNATAAIVVARQLGVRHIEKRSNELEDPRYARNPVNRCYYCKTELYTLAEAEASV